MALPTVIVDNDSGHNDHHEIIHALMPTGESVQIKLKAGTPIDGDFTSTPSNGTIVINSSTDRIWYRKGGVWTEITSASGAPVGAPYLVTAADAALSSEVVVGATPGGELGGTWAAPTVDATHSGSAHSAHITKAIATAKGDLLAASANATIGSLPVGPNNQVLTADSAQTLGVKWATPAAGGGGTEFLNVKTDYLAVGDGVADDTAEVQAAIDAATAAGGGIVFFPPGTFLCAPLLMKSNVTLQGTGWGSIIKQKNSSFNQWGLIYNKYSYQGGALITNVAVKDLQIDGNKANNTDGGGIALWNAKGMTVTNCYVHDSPTANIATGDNDPGRGKVVISGNWSHNPALSGNYWGGIGITSGEDIVVTNNICTSSDGFQAYGIDIEQNATAGWLVSRTVCANNLIQNGGLHHIGASGNEFDHAIIANNSVNAISTAGVSAGIRVERVSNALVTGNNVAGPAHTNAGMRIMVCVDAMITNNRITGMGSAQNTYPDNVGVLLESCTNPTVMNNYIYSPTATHATAIAGIRNVSSTGVRVALNQMRNITVKGYGDFATGSTFDSEAGYLVNGNEFVDTSRNVRAGTLAATSGGATIMTLFGGLVRMANATDFEFATTTGTKLGTSTSEKLGFWGATPVARQTVTGSRGGNAALADLLNKLAAAGIITDSTS